MKKVYPELLEEYPQSLQVIIKKLHNRVESGKNALIGVFGQTGGGKSLLVLQMMRGLYMYRYGKEPEDKELLEHLFFRASHFMKAMKTISDGLVKDKSKLIIGQAWCWDEVGVDAGHKEALTIKNRVIGWAAQTFRNLKQIIFFTTPSISFIDSDVRKLLHYYIEAVSIDKKRKITIAKPLELQYNVRMNKIYYHNLKTNSKKGYYEINFVGVPKISDELENDYELKKNEFTGNLNEEIFMQLSRIEKNKSLVNLRINQREVYIIYHKKTKVQVEIAKILGKHSSTISSAMRSMDKNYPEWRYNKKLLGNLDNLQYQVIE